MFETLLFYTPVCVLVLIATWFISRWQSWSLKILIAVVAPILISFAWDFLPKLPDWFRPLRPGQEAWIPWAFIGATSRSIVAVPLSILALILFSVYRAKRRSSESS